MYNTIPFGWHFARIKGSDRLTIVGCWGDRIEKQVKEDVEVLEKVPADVIKVCSNGVKILNLDKFVREMQQKYPNLMYEVEIHD